MPDRALSSKILAVAKMMEDECQHDMPYYPNDVAKFVGMMMLLADSAVHLEAALCAEKGIPHVLNKPKVAPQLLVIGGTDHEEDAQ